jgi:hypothetical protein
MGQQSKARFLRWPCIRHYRCYKLVKLETKQKVISNTLEFRHACLLIPVVLADDKIVNGLQVMAGALQIAPPITSSTQLDAIEMLCTLFEKWKLLALPALLNEGHALCLPCASLPSSHCSLPNTTPAQNHTNNLFHALENDNDNDTPGATTWSPPLLPASIPHMPVQGAQVTPFQQATPMRLVFNEVASPSVSNTTPQLPLPLPLPRVSKSPSPVV